MINSDLQLKRVRDLYLDMLKKSLTYSLWGESYHPIYLKEFINPINRIILYFILKRLLRRDIHLFKRVIFNESSRREGKDHPVLGHTMIGSRRLDNIQYCIEQVIFNNIPGDLIETGVWRGGATIFMRGVLRAYEDSERKVWVADSFEGLPKPNKKKYPADTGDDHYTMLHLAVSEEEVRGNFERYDLLDDQVKFLKGWFKDTLPKAPIEKLAVLRLDGDMYESTIDSLTWLYPKLSIGGYVIIDDYGYIESCKQAVNDYRMKYQITDEIIPIDWSGVYWKRSQ